jgi:signal peptidase II
MNRMRWFWLCALLVVALDQATKVWVRAALPVMESRDVIAGWLSWTHVHNPGAAWGVLAGQEVAFGGCGGSCYSGRREFCS